MKGAFFRIEKLLMMALWTLELDSNHNSFRFPLDGDKILFDELVSNCFENSQPVSDKWQTLYMLRTEPKKHSDFFEIEQSDVIAISQKAADCLKQLIASTIELLPIETDAGKYYALNVLNFVDCLNRKESVYVAAKDGVIASYSSLEFFQDKIPKHGFFKIPELPYCTFVSDYVLDECEENFLQGLVFDTESNLAWSSD
jgi:hypothetical protein